jgi:hypothetical protein
MTGEPYRFNSAKTNVSSISGSARIDRLDSGLSTTINILYSTDGTNFYIGTTINCPVGVQVPFTINFGSSTKTITALFVMPSTKTWPFYELTFWHPKVVRTLTDNTAPTITAIASDKWNTTNTIIVSVSDSESGVLRKKWAYGNVSVSYFSSNGTTFTEDEITVTQNGTYSIYAIDNAGNATVKTVTVSYVDNFVSVTHPISVNYSINPNDGNPFTADDIVIRNNSQIKVKIMVRSFAPDYVESIKFYDVLPSYFSDWTKINKEQTKSYIALGYQVKETHIGSNTWDTMDTYPRFAENINSDTYVGILNPNGAVGTLKVIGQCGLAWDNYYTARHVMNFLFEAYYD